MRAGALRHNLTIQNRQATPDGFGQGADTWLNFATDVWASIDPIGAREFFQAQQAQGSVTHRIRCRYVPGVTQEMRIAYEGRIFKMAAPPRDLGDLNAEMELLAEEVIA